MWILKWIVGAFIFILILWFAFENQGELTHVKFLKWQSPEIPLYVFLYISYIAGIVTWLLISIFKILKLKNDKYVLQRELRAKKDEINRLRNISIEDEVEPEIPEKKQLPSNEETAA